MQARDLLGATGNALCIAIALSAMAIVAPSNVGAAEQTVSAELGKPVSAAQEAIKKKQWPQALEQIKAAQAVAKSASDNYAIDSMLSYVLNEQKNYAEAIKVYERMLNSGQVPPNQVEARTKTVADLYYATKNYGEAAKWYKKVLDRNPQDQVTSVWLGQSYYQMGDYKNAAATMTGLIAAAERAGKAPQESWLRIAQNSYLQLGNRAGMLEVLLKLVRTFQKPEDWELMLNGYADRMRTDPVKLNYFRLKLDTGVLKRPDDYMDLALLAMDAGVGDEARQVMEVGVKNGHLKTANKTEQGRYDRILASAKTQAGDSVATLNKLSSEAAAATNGNAYLTLGQLHLNNRNYDKAVEAIQSGIKKGGLTDADQAHVLLGIAYIKAGQKDHARQAFKAVKKDSKWNELAGLWTLRV